MSKHAELVNLYHLARTALAGKDNSRYQRMLWAAALPWALTGAVLLARWAARGFGARKPIARQPRRA